MTLKTRTLLLNVALVLLLLVCNSCGIYSFTGTTISPDIKSITIQTFENSTGEGPSNLSLIVTNNFKEYYRRNTNLILAQGEGDLQLEGQIVSFTYTPAAIQREGQQDIAGLNRLTLGVQIRFANAKQPEKDFDRLFSISQDFPQDLDITQLSTAQIEQLTERLVADVFNKTVADW
ncbi:lipopolysaccharide assembly protein [Pontibacter ummariensis]|uniref:Lipopolysaccharide-assembly n=1 Tax=Pontibacter ummariensis TaxID=1610492 RepID=A0A239BP54_9BACT|nr:LptE family protein [Pontibacter ummariensis]PRY15721.1 lipopolysaccharide assembly protein [Pontibacter ummariensis]SNS09422.1 Lipopolysaccharide-assembly [Pontibacter ummariensis]